MALQVLHLIRANSEVRNKGHLHHFLDELLLPVVYLQRPGGHAKVVVVVQAEFEDICEEAQLWTRLHDLEQLCQEQGLLDDANAAEGCVS